MNNVCARWPLLTLLCWCTAAIGQINGRFYLEKSAFALGEPVFLYFEASNSGQETQDIIRANPYSFCSGYKIHVSTDPSPASSCVLVQPAGSCAYSSMTLEPGAKYAERILLNYAHEVVAPGDYVVEAGRHLPHGPGGAQLPLVPAPVLEVHQRLDFRVELNAKFDSNQLKVWVDQLQSTDIAKRSEAALTLASLAPRSLEDTLLGFIENEEFRYRAPLAMHRLNTPRSMVVLAQMLQRTKPGTPEKY
jgi:hypothetical protein